MPAGAWFRTHLREFVRDTLLGHDSACSRYFDRQAIEDIVTLHEKGKFSGYQEVWSLVVFEQWHKQFIEECDIAYASGKTAVEPDEYVGRGA